VSQSDNG